MTTKIFNFLLLFIVSNAFDIASAKIETPVHITTHIPHDQPLPMRITTHVDKEQPTTSNAQPQAASVEPAQPAVAGTQPTPDAGSQPGTGPQPVPSAGGGVDISKFGPLTGDISKALMSAWKEVCATGGKIVIPKGDFLLNPVSIEGPCKGPVEIEIVGNLMAPTQIADFKNTDAWIKFERITGLTIRGLPAGGVFDGKGQNFWKANDCKKNNMCFLPCNIRFDYLTDSFISGITSKDSKSFNMHVLGSKNTTLQDIKINCPNDLIAPNTDGIHIGVSENIKILNSEIKTGDDCVSIVYGTKNLLVENVTCGPGHGISVGSMGKYENETPITGVNVKNCVITDTLNGVRIKTWLNSFPAVGSDLHFEGIKINNVTFPIIFDQSYCPNNLCKQQIPSKVKISNVSFKDITGTSSTPSAIRLICSSTTPCEGIDLSNIDIKYTGPNGPAICECANIKPLTSGPVNPPICSKIVPEFTPFT